MSDASSIWLDGEPADALALPDRGLDFGDGLFETLLLHSGRAQFADLHLARLARGAAVLSLPITLSLIEEHLAIASQAAQNRRWSALRLTLTRGTGPRGYAPPDNPQPRIIMQLTPLSRAGDEPSAPASVGLPGHRLSEQPALAGIKHLNRLDQVMAAQQVQRMGCEEGLMLNQAGDVISLIAGNLFLVEGDRLITPLLEGAGVSGTRRSLVINEWAARAGLMVSEETISPQQVASADECFYTNALFGLRAIGECDGASWPSHPVTDQLFTYYREALY
ncbi:MAG: aminodeoxychorismate lyase [Halioglobus sp.]